MRGGRYPSDEFARLRPRVVWDRLAGTIRGRAGAQRLAVVSGGTIPDRGLYSVNLLADGKRVGELDEEMVYEMRPGETFVLGATTWRVADITNSQVLVPPAPGEPGRISFWHGDALGRPIEVGRALGKTTRELLAVSTEAAIDRLNVFETAVVPGRADLPSAVELDVLVLVEPRSVEHRSVVIEERVLQ